MNLQPTDDRPSNRTLVIVAIIAAAVLAFDLSQDQPSTIVVISALILIASILLRLQVRGRRQQARGGVN